MNYNQLKKIIDDEVNKLHWENNAVEEASYYALKEGKRLRPVLLLAFSQIFSEDYEKAMPYALALEMIHNYSLIHDDLPCMDDDEYRRGQLTVHAKYGEDIAVLAGDNLLNKAYELIFEDLLASNDLNKVKAGEYICRSAGMKGMIGGQVIDILNSAKTAEDVVRMYHLKTSALIKAACVSGTLLSGKVEYLNFAEQFGDNLGLLFQLTDDLLDLEEDEKIGKITYLSFHSKDKLENDLNSLEKEMRTSLQSIYYNTEVLEGIYLKMMNREV